jgi:hypothetical protein
VQPNLKNAFSGGFFPYVAVLERGEIRKAFLLSLFSMADEIGSSAALEN